MPKHRNKYQAKMSNSDRTIEAEFNTKSEILRWVESRTREGYKLNYCNYDGQFNLSEVRKDCFAYGQNENAKCAILYKKECKNCKFYKTKKQFEEDMKKSQNYDIKEEQNDD